MYEWETILKGVVIADMSILITLFAVTAFLVVYKLIKNSK